MGSSARASANDVSMPITMAVTMAMAIGRSSAEKDNGSISIVSNFSSVSA